MRNIFSLCVFCICLCAVFLPDLAIAGVDPLSEDLENNTQNLIQSSGKIIALISFFLGLTIAAVKMNLMPFVFSVAVSLASLFGMPVITGLFSAII